MTDTMTADEYLELVDDEDEKLGWFLREVRRGYEEGKTPKEIVNGLYYQVEETPTRIEYQVVLSVIFGILWERDDQSVNTSD